jgi:HEAT repeat protein
MDDHDHLDQLLADLYAPDLDDRLAAIRALSESGDEDALHVLRGRLAAVNKEFGALVVAVDKLKKKLGVR